MAFGLTCAHHVEFIDAVILVLGGFRRRIALALLGYDMDQHGAADIGVADVFQHRQEVIEIMSVDGADVIEAEFLEQCAAVNIGAGVLDGAGDRAFDGFGQVADDRLAGVAQAQIGAA